MAIYFKSFAFSPIQEIIDLPSSTYSIALSGVPGFKTTPAFAPKLLIWIRQIYILSRNWWMTWRDVLRKVTHEKYKTRKKWLRKLGTLCLIQSLNNAHWFWCLRGIGWRDMCCVLLWLKTTRYKNLSSSPIFLPWCHKEFVLFCI